MKQPALGLAVALIKAPMGDIRVEGIGRGGIGPVAAGEGEGLAVVAQGQGEIAGADSLPAVFIGEDNR